MFANLSYLLRVWKIQSGDQEVTRVFPWTLWYLWKNRNSLLFEGIIYHGEQVCEKSREAAELWYAAQNLQEDVVEASIGDSRCEDRLWQAPPWSFVKCNIGVGWSKKTKMAGASWVLCDYRGVALFHSRRSFGSVGSKDEALFLLLSEL